MTETYDQIKRQRDEARKRVDKWLWESTDRQSVDQEWPIEHKNDTIRMVAEVLSERDEARAACAEMRRALIHCFSWLGCDECQGDTYCETCRLQKEVMEKALNHNCGHDLLAELERKTAALESISKRPANCADALKMQLDAREALNPQTK